MKYLISFTLLALFTAARPALGQCAETARFLNTACCDGSIFVETIPAGRDVPTGYEDGQTVCGIDSIGNPCTIPQVQNCPSGASIRGGLANYDKRVLTATANAKRMLAGTRYEQLAGVVAFCTLSSQHSLAEYKLPPLKLGQW